MFVKLAFREIRTALLYPVRWFIWVMITMVCVFSGPFGTTENVSALTLTAFWVIVVGVSIVVAEFVKAGTKRITVFSKIWLHQIV